MLHSSPQRAFFSPALFLFCNGYFEGQGSLEVAIWAEPGWTSSISESHLCPKPPALSASAQVPECQHTYTTQHWKLCTSLSRWLIAMTVDGSTPLPNIDSSCALRVVWNQPVRRLFTIIQRPSLLPLANFRGIRQRLLLAFRSGVCLVPLGWVCIHVKNVEIHQREEQMIHTCIAGSWHQHTMCFIGMLETPMATMDLQHLPSRVLEHSNGFTSPISAMICPLKQHHKILCWRMFQLKPPFPMGSPSFSPFEWPQTGG